VVDYVIGQRMKRNVHTRWTREGANAESGQKQGGIFGMK
jgi:hypothetical protein